MILNVLFSVCSPYIFGCLASHRRKTLPKGEHLRIKNCIFFGRGLTKTLWPKPSKPSEMTITSWNSNVKHHQVTNTWWIILKFGNPIKRTQIIPPNNPNNPINPILEYGNPIKQSHKVGPSNSNDPRNTIVICVLYKESP